MDELQSWLKNKDYNTGVQLYLKLGSSAFLKEVFQSGETDFTREKLDEELVKLAELSNRQLPVWSRGAMKENHLDYFKDLKIDGLEKVIVGRSFYDYQREYLNSPVPEPEPEKPDAADSIRYTTKQNHNQNNIQYLKLCKKRDELNRQISRNMVLLDETRSKTRRHETAKQILILYRKKTQVWAEIDYYTENGSLMPVAVKPELKTDELQRLYVQICRARDRLQQTELRNRDKTEKLLKDKLDRVEQIRLERGLK